MANLWHVAVDYDHREWSQRLKSMAAEQCQSGLHEMGFRHERETGDDFPTGEITDEPTNTHIMPLEGGFHVRTHPVKEAITGQERHRVVVDDSTDLGDHIVREMGFGGERSSRFDEINGIHPDLMHNITEPASISVHDPKHLPQAVHTLLRHPETLRAMRETQRARGLSGSELDDACADHHPHHIRADGTSDTTSPQEQPRWYDGDE